MFHRRSVALIVLGTLGILSSSRASDGPMVTTEYGKIIGIFKNDGTQVFYGIPYAAPPMGSNRWRAPRAPAVWNPRVLQARIPGPSCPSVNHCPNDMVGIICTKKMSEDCLYLNVFAPIGTNATSNLAVMVFIHGGNFEGMTGSLAIYDGQKMVNKGHVILVTLDYRLGALGFLVAGEGTDAAVGNFGILDQRMALKWVQNNIRSFGGDPSRVTLFGESAGAESTAVHLVSARSASYFHRAILQSEPFSEPFRSRREAHILGKYFAHTLNCSAGNMNCLRSKSVHEIIHAQYVAAHGALSRNFLQMAQAWGPNIDGHEVEHQSLISFTRHGAIKKPFILGTTKEEARPFIYRLVAQSGMSYLSDFSYKILIRAVFGKKATHVLEQYPTVVKDQRPLLSRLGTDFIFTCPTILAALQAVAGGSRDVWLYTFDQGIRIPAKIEKLMNHSRYGSIFEACRNHSCHGSELLFVFQATDKIGFSMNSEELALSDAMISYWTQFAKTGDPNGNAQNSGLHWPRFDHTKMSMRFICPKLQVVSNQMKKSCQFWDSLDQYIVPSN